MGGGWSPPSKNISDPFQERLSHFFKKVFSYFTCGDIREKYRLNSWSLRSKHAAIIQYSGQWVQEYNSLSQWIKKQIPKWINSHMHYILICKLYNMNALLIFDSEPISERFFPSGQSLGLYLSYLNSFWYGWAFNRLPISQFHASPSPCPN